MKAIRKTGKCVFILVLTLIVCSCSPTVYKKEVGLFSQGVENATSTFEKLRQKNLAIEQKKLENKLAGNRIDIEASHECSDIVNKMQKQARCLAEWAKFHAKKIDIKPTCSEPLDFYESPIELILKCQIGPLDNNMQVEPNKLEPDAVYEQTALMSKKLSEYASALSEIVDSKDIDELQSALGEAKTAVEGLANRYKDSTNKEVPNVEAIGPISELVGTVATSALEWRRFNAMKKIVNRADPIVTAAAKRLSINAMPLLLKTRIRPAKEKLIKAAEEFNPIFMKKKDFNYPKKLKSIKEAYTAYIQNLKNDPSSAFEALAGAHTALKDALNEPKTQFENLQEKIKNFYEKAKGAYDTLNESSN
jgi:hypothetical protein